MKFKTKVLSAAVLAAVGVTSAQAVTVAPDGLGQVLLYPYFTVEGGYNTLISVVNTTTRGKAVKVRFLESLNSREVLDFNLYLSPLDVWTGMITADAGGGAKIVVTDTSCTAPIIAAANGGSGEQAFFTYGFDGSSGVAADAEAGRGVARTREGYVELIEMGDIDPEYVMPTPNSNFLTAITHVGGKPKACGDVVSEWAATKFPSNNGPTLTADLRGLTAPTGGLAGTGTLINVEKGTDYSYDPTPLAGFYTLQRHTEPGDLFPSLAQAQNVSAVVVADQATGAVNVANTTWTHPTYGGVDAVSAALMRSNIINEFVVNTAIHAGTDWVVTMPTKRWYVDRATIETLGANTTISRGVRPFQSLFAAGGACETISMSFTNQEEDKKTGSIGFSPAPQGKSQSICWEANVITFNNSNVLASPQTATSHNINVGSYPAGWLNLSFPSAASTSNLPNDAEGGTGVGVNPPDTTDGGDVASHQMGISDGTNDETYMGLPVIGFAVQQYVNDVLAGGVLSNYGGSFGHKYIRTVTGNGTISASNPLGLD